MINQNIVGNIRYMDIWKVNLPLDPETHVQGGQRPALIVSNDDVNAYSGVVTIVPITKSMKRKAVPCNIPLVGFGLRLSSLALCEQVQTIDKRQLCHKIGTVNDPVKVVELKRALIAQMNLAA